MLKHYLHLLALSVLLILSTTVSHAEEPEKTEKVVATEYGVNADKAKENAVRNAVEQVIGTYVTSDTIVKNSQLVKDEILSFSGGYVKETRTPLYSGLTRRTYCFSPTASTLQLLRLR